MHVTTTDGSWRARRRCRLQVSSKQLCERASPRCPAQNVMTKDAVIATARVPLTQTYHVACQDLRLPLVSEKGKAAGELNMLVQWKPYQVGGAPAATPTRAAAAVAAPQPQPAPYPVQQPHAQAAPAHPAKPAMYPQLYEPPKV